MNREDLNKKITNLTKLKSTYCYNSEKSKSEFCITLNYQIWLLNLEYQKYSDNKK